MDENNISAPSDEIHLSRDSLFAGALSCWQHVDGYRFSIDAVLLAHFPRIKKEEQVLDLGTGCGIVGLILCYRNASMGIHVTGMEVQSALARLARQNIAANNYADRFSIIEGSLQDCRVLIEPESFSLVTANPPFFSSGTGRVSSNNEAKTARHQQGDGLQLFVEAAAYAVKNRGRVVFIYPADQAALLLNGLEDRRLVPKKMQPVYSYPAAKKASLVLVEAVKNGGNGMELLHPLYIYRYRNGPYSAPVTAMFQPE